MPEFEFGNMWNAYSKTDSFCITTNSFIKNNGCLVMGRGIAKTARDVIDGIDEKLGKRIDERCGHLGSYGIIPADPDESRIVAFQVKTHFKEQANLDLIQQATEKLNSVASNHSDRRFDLNFPGIGNGGRSVEEVKPIIEELPNNVHIWRFSEE